MKTCPACKNESTDATDKCIVCNYPYNGSETEKSIHIGQFITKKGVNHDADYHLDRTQKIILAIAILNFAILVFYVFSGFFDLIAISIDIIVIAIFAFSGLTIRKNPTFKILLALSTYVGVNLLVFLINPNALLQGIIIKLIIIGSLIYSMYLVNASEKFKRKFGS